MYKKIILLSLLMISLLLGAAKESEARRGFAIGLGGVGNIYLIDTLPVMNPGYGGYTFFQYRFSDAFAFETGFMITNQNGTNVSAGDSGILFLGMPTIDLKFYFLQGDPRFDPFISLGTGLYILTEGKSSDDSGGIGVGTNLGVGFDYFMTPVISLGFQGVFRTIGIISDFGTPSKSAAIFPYSLMGNIAFHF
jgi:outer membrane protein W